MKCHFHPSPITSTPYLSILDIPLKYYLQVQGYLNIVGVDTGYLFSWTINNGWTLFKITYDRTLFDQVVALEGYQFHVRLQEAKELAREGKAVETDYLKFKSGEKKALEEKIRYSLKTNTHISESHWPRDM